MSRITIQRLVVAWYLAAQPAAAVAVDHGESLAALVGRDVALFIELRGLDRHTSALAQSDLGRRWAASGVAGASGWVPFEPFQKWHTLDTHVAAVTGTALTTQLRALFAESVALALYLPASGEPQGVLLARAASAEAIDRVLASWAMLEPPQRMERRTSAGGGPYFQRIVGRKGGERSLFFARRDRLFVLSDHEHLVRDCVERADNQSPAESLQESGDFRGMLDQLHDESWAIAWLNPRRWDAAFARDAALSPTSQQLLDAWKSFRAIVAGIHTTNGVHAELLVSLDEGQMGSAWREFAQPAAPPSIVASAPPRAVAVLGAHVRLSWLVAQWERLLSTHDRDELEKVRRVLRGLLMGQDFLTDVLPHVLGDWGVALEYHGPPDHPAEWWRAWDGVAISFLSADMPPPVRESVDNALLFALNLLAVDRNNRADTANWYVTRSDTPQALRCVLIGASGVEPSFLWQPGQLVLANHSALLDRTASGNQHSRLASAVSTQFPDARIFVWFDLQQLRQSVGSLDSAAFAPAAMANGLRPLAKLGDQMFIAASWKESEIRIRAGLTIEPR